MSVDTKAFFTHVLACQLQHRLRHDEEHFAGVPMPRATFVHVYCRGYKWEEINSKELMWRSGYSIEEKRCMCYGLHDELIEEFIVAGEEFLLSFSNIRELAFYDLVTGKKQPRLIKPFYPNVGSTQIDLGYGIGWLKREKEWIEENKSVLTEKQYNKYVRSYHHALRCFQGMLERLTSINYTKWQAEYSQELIEPDEGLRRYEIGGGLQGCNKGLREALLCTSPVINYDAVKCHATIAKVKMEEMGIDSGLQELLDNSVTPPHHLLKADTVKTAILAILNGAKLSYKLTSNTTLPRLIKDDTRYAEIPPLVQAEMLVALSNRCKHVHASVKTWAKTIEKHERIAKVSAYLQRIETQELAQLMSVATNCQHDGALVPIGVYVSPSTTLLTIQAKAISTPDKRFSSPLRSVGPTNEEDFQFISTQRELCQHDPNLYREVVALVPTPAPIPANKNTDYISQSLDLAQLTLSVQ